MFDVQTVVGVAILSAICNHSNYITMVTVNTLDTNFQLNIKREGIIVNQIW